MRMENIGRTDRKLLGRVEEKLRRWSHPWRSGRSRRRGGGEPDFAISEWEILQ